MRILFATTRGAGHLGPLVPFAHACVAAGHEVRVAAAPSVEHHVRRSGLPFAPWTSRTRRSWPPRGSRSARAERADQARIVFQEVFAGEFARSALPRMVEIARRWRPDVIVRETSEFASVLAADAIGVPTVHVACFLSGVGDRELGVDEALGSLRPGFRMPPDEPFLTLAPRALEHPDQPEAPGVRRFRAPRLPARPLPDWWDGSADAAGLRLLRLLRGRQRLLPRHLPRGRRGAGRAARCACCSTLGTEVDPAELGPVAANVHVEPWVPQGAVMAHASAMVGHGGSGSTLAAMAAGMPLAVAAAVRRPARERRPRRRARRGPAARRDGRARRRVSELLEDPYYRDSARSVAAEIEELPPVDAAWSCSMRSARRTALAA